ncbi:secreted protein, partial [Rhodopirellula maiorica SM1]
MLRSLSLLWLIALILAGLDTSVALAERDPIRLTHGPMLGMSTAHSVKVWGEHRTRARS